MRFSEGESCGEGYESPQAGLDRQAQEKKEAPTLHRRDVTLQKAEQAAPKQQNPIQGNPPSATTPSVQFGSPPLGPEERWKQQLEERARLRAEWRGRRR